MKTLLIGTVIAFVTVVLTYSFFDNPAVYACCIWSLGSLSIAFLWMFFYRKDYIHRNPNDSNPMCIELVGFYLTLLGILLTLNGDVILESNDLGKSLYRMFDKENKTDFSKLFPSDTISDDIENCNPHIIIGLDVSGSLEEPSQRWNTDIEFNKDYDKMYSEVNSYATLFSGMNNSGIESKMENFFEKKNKSILFRLRALQFVMNLDSLNRMEKDSKKLNLTIVKFGNHTHIKSVGKNYSLAIPYLLDIESSSSSKMFNCTDFVRLFHDINHSICPNTNEKDRQRKPQYVFAFFTDFLHDPKMRRELKESYPMEYQRNLIRRELENFNSKSNFSTFYFFPSDTILNDDYRRNMDKKIFSVFPLLKSGDDWMNVKPVQDMSMIDLGVYRTKECLTLYYTKPYVVEDSVKVKLTFNDYANENQFTLALKDIESLPLRDQYVFYEGTKNKQKKLLGRIPRTFEAYKDIPVTIMFQGYVKNQIPSRIFELKDLKSGRKYEFDVIFIKDFAPWVKYVFFCITYLFIVMFMAKLYKSWRATRVNRNDTIKTDEEQYHVSLFGFPLNNKISETKSLIPIGKNVFFRRLAVEKDFQNPFLNFIMVFLFSKKTNYSFSTICLLLMIVFTALMMLWLMWLTSLVC